MYPQCTIYEEERQTEWFSLPFPPYCLDLGIFVNIYTHMYKGERTQNREGEKDDDPRDLKSLVLST